MKIEWKSKKERGTLSLKGHGKSDNEKQSWPDNFYFKVQEFVHNPPVAIFGKFLVESLRLVRWISGKLHYGHAMMLCSFCSGRPWNLDRAAVSWCFSCSSRGSLKFHFHTVSSGEHHSFLHSLRQIEICGSRVASTMTSVSGKTYLCPNMSWLLYQSSPPTINVNAT